MRIHASCFLQAKIIVQDMMPIWIPIGFATLAVDRKTRIQSGFDLSSICFDCDVQQRLGSFVLDTLINHMQRDGKLQDWVSPQIQDMLNLTFDAGSENISTSTRLLLGALESLVGAENPALDHSQRDIPSTLLSVASDHIRFPVRHMPSGTAKSAYASALARGLGNTALAGHKSFAPLALTMAFVALESSSPIAGNLDPRFEGEGTSDLHYDANGTHVGCEVCQVPNEDQALHEEMVSLLQSLYALDDSLLSKTGRYHSTAEKAETVHARAGFEELQLNGLAKLRLAHVLHLHGCAQAEAEVLASALSSLQDRDWDASGWMHEYEDEERGERIMGTLSALLRSAEARAIEEVQQRWARTTTTSSKATLSDVGRELRRSPRHRQIVDVLTPRMTNPLRREWQFEELIDAWILVTPNAAASRQQNSKTATVMPEAEDATFSPPSSPTSSSYAGSALAYRRARPSCLMPDTPPRTPRQHTRNSGKQAQDTPGPAANLMRSLRKFRAQAPRGSETEVDQSARSRAIESDNMRESVADLKQSSRRLQRIAQPRFSRPLRRIVSEPVTPPSLRIHERDDVFESETDELDLIEIKTPVPPRRRREPARFDVGQQEAKRRASSAVPAPVPAPKRQRLGSGEENAFPSRTRRRS